MVVITRARVASEGMTTNDAMFVVALAPNGIAIDVESLRRVRDFFLDFQPHELHILGAPGEDIAALHAFVTGEASVPTGRTLH